MSKLINILVVDDFPKPRKYMHKKLCSNPQWSVDMASSEKEAVQKINDNRYDIIVTDMYMEKRNSGLNVLYAAKKKDKRIEVIIITGYASTQETVEAMREGAYNYINKDETTPYALMYKIVESAVKKRDNPHFDVFFSYNSKDVDRVKEIAIVLKNNGKCPWLDKWEIKPGEHFYNEIKIIIEKIGVVAFFISDNDQGDWQREELQLCKYEQIKRKIKIIPIILENSSNSIKLPTELKFFNAIDFREIDPDPIKRFLNAI